MLALFGTSTATAQVSTVGATAQVHDSANRLVATADFREGHGEVQITISFSSPPVLSGTHAIHILETGRCDPPDFTTAGNIFNPFNKKHGRQNPEGAEVGDLPNVNFSNGLTSYNTTATGATLGAGAGSLLSPNRALVIFSGEDDQITDPDGNPGSRVACGVITASNGTSAAAPVAQPGAPLAQPGAPPVAQPGAPGVAAVPTLTPTPNIAPAVPKIASPVPQPGQPISPAQAGQPAPVSKPTSSPIVVPKPVVVNNGAPSPSPIVAAAAPTPILVPTVAPAPVAATAPQQASGGGIGSLTALVIAVLGVGLVGVGYLLRRRSQLQ